MADKDEPQLAISDFNLQVIDTEQYAEVLDGTIQSGTSLAVFGRRGSGKTEIAKQVIASSEIGEKGEGKRAREVYINLSTAERTDMGGYPDMFGLMRSAKTDAEKVEQFISFVLPMFYEPMINRDQPVVALFDEVDKADSSIHAPMLEILQFKSINHRPLPNLRSSIMTGNLISEGSQRPSLPLLDRIEKYHLQTNIGGFSKWAAKSNKIHPSVFAFLNDKPSFLFGSNDGAGELYAEESPRGWENTSKVLWFGEKAGWSKDLMYLKVAGFVGKRAALEYQIYFEHYRELMPLIDAIFRGEDCVARYKDLDPSMQIYCAMIVCSRVSGILDKVPQGEDAPEWKPVELAYIGKFMQKAVADENILIAVRTQLTLDRVVRWELDQNKDWGRILIDVTNSVDK